MQRLGLGIRGVRGDPDLSDAQQQIPSTLHRTTPNTLAGSIAARQERREVERKVCGALQQHMERKARDAGNGRSC